MFPHIYLQRPRYCVAFKAKMILVRLPSGEIQEEYFGPADRNSIAAELELLRRELEAASAILAGHKTGNHPPLAA